MENYLGEIRIFAGNYAPQNWHYCDGSLLNINDYEALYSLIGTTYGGDGRTTFALPDLRGKVPVGAGQFSGGNNYTLGQIGGTTAVTITTDNMPAHNHALNANTANATTGDPTGINIPALSLPTGTPGYPNVKLYAALPSGEGPDAPLDPRAVINVGGSQSHSNIMPNMTINYIIALIGIYPSQN